MCVCVRARAVLASLASSIIHDDSQEEEEEEEEEEDGLPIFFILCRKCQMLIASRSGLSFRDRDEEREKENR